MITSPPAPEKQLQQMKVKCSVIWGPAINEGKYSTYQGSLWQNLEGCLVHLQEAIESTQYKLDMYDEKQNHAEMEHNKHSVQHVKKNQSLLLNHTLCT